MGPRPTGPGEERWAGAGVLRHEGESYLCVSGRRGYWCAEASSTGWIPRLSVARGMSLTMGAGGLDSA